MADDKKLRIERLEDEIDRQILEASDADIIQDAIDAGDDPVEFAGRMKAWLQGAIEMAGKSRLQKARSELEQQRSSDNVVPLRGRLSKRPTNFVPDTMAARLGKELSDKDKQALEEDYDELFDDSAWNNDESDEDR
jgi:hypothetical protein